MTESSDSRIDLALAQWPVMAPPPAFAARTVDAIFAETTSPDVDESTAGADNVESFGSQLLRVAAAAALVGITATAALETRWQFKLLFAETHPWHFVKNVLLCLAAVLAVVGLLGRSAALRALAVGLSAQWLYVSFIPSSIWRESEMIVTRSLSDGWLPPEAVLALALAATAVSILALRRAWRPSHWRPVYVCLLFAPVGLFFEVYPSIWMADDQLAVLVVTGAALGSVALGAWLHARDGRYARRLSWFFFAVAAIAASSGRTGGGWQELFHRTQLLFAGVAPGFLLLSAGHLRRMWARFGDGGDSAGVLHRAALVKRESPPRLTSIVECLVGIGLVAASVRGALGHEFFPVLDGFTAAFVRAARGSQVAVGLLIVLGLAGGISLVARSIRGVFGLAMPSASRLGLVLRGAVVAVVAVYLALWAALGGHAHHTWPIVSPVVGILLSAVAWIAAARDTPSSVVDAWRCVRSRFDLLSVPSADLASPTAGRRVRVSGVIEADDEAFASDSVYEERLTVPEPRPTGGPFVLRVGDQRARVELDPRFATVAGVPDSGDVLRLRVGDEVTVVGELRVDADPYRKGVANLRGSVDAPIAIFAQAEAVNRRLLVAGAIELVTGGLLLATGALLVAVWFVVL